MKTHLDHLVDVGLFEAAGADSFLDHPFGQEVQQGVEDGRLHFVEVPLVREVHCKDEVKVVVWGGLWRENMTRSSTVQPDVPDSHRLLAL